MTTLEGSKCNLFYALGNNSWFVCHRPNPVARLRLFGFPYAGGGASSYCSWSKDLPSDIEIVGVQMPGLEGRRVDSGAPNIPILVQALAEVMYRDLGRPFALFGHSFGALIAFEIGRQLRRQYQCGPVHFFGSGSRAPQIPVSEVPINHLTDKAFVRELQRRYNCIPDEILQNRDILKELLPGLRESVRLYESYKYSNGDPLDCPITVFGGLQDDTVNREGLEAWRYQTKATFSLHMIPGDHFFIHFAREHFLRTLSDEIKRILTGLG